MKLGLENVDISWNTTKRDYNDSIPKHNTELLGPPTCKWEGSLFWKPSTEIVMKEKDSVNTLLPTKMTISVFKKNHTYTYTKTHLLMWKSLLCKILCNIYHDSLQKCCTWGYMVLWGDINLIKITFIKFKRKKTDTST